MAATPATSLTLISSGLADARLQPTRGNPDIAQFVKVLRKTTRWAAQWNRVNFDGDPQFGQRVSLTVPRIAELVTGLQIVVTMPDIYAVQLRAIQAAGGTNLTNPGTFLGPVYGWTNSLGHALIQQIELEIGGAIVESLDSRQLEMQDELYETLESAIAKNAMIKRAPNGFTATTWLSPIPTTVQVPIPFWFSRPGVSSHALPLDALNAEIVRIHVTFRALNSLFYTAARVDSRTVGYNGNGDTTGMYNLLGGRFWKSNPAAAGRVYSMNPSTPVTGISGELIDGVRMPLRFDPIAAYAMIEYVSLEEYEALAFRTAELTYPVEQHLAIPIQETLGSTEVRFAIPYSNPTKELMWVFQRPEVAQYNAWFLFTRDLCGPAPPPFVPGPPQNPCTIPWWPNASLIPTEANLYQVVPAFQTSYSEPLAAATLLYNSYERFSQEGGSFFRTVQPARFYVKSAIHDRYVYAYNFGQKAERLMYGPSGAANWDKIPRKELFMTLNRGPLGSSPPNLNLYVYVTIWNMFKVYGGRGGMLFSN
jgi:hypothetical protein